MKANVNPLYAQRQKKFLLVLPVLVLPFVVFLLWVLGLVGSETASGQLAWGNGLNLTLPTAVSKKDSGWNKLQFYEQADEDSIRRRQDQKKDPYYRQQADSVLKKSASHFAYSPYPESALSQADREEQKANEKIKVIQHELTRKPVAKKENITASAPVHSPDVDRLENMMHQMKDDQQPDSDLIRMNQLMQRIMEVQHPELVQQKIKEQQKQQKVFAVETSQRDGVNVSMHVAANRFYSLDDEHPETSGNGIAAVVQDNQIISDGAVLKMRLTQAVFINDREIPENQFVYGVAKLSSNRMLIAVNGVQIDNDVLPVHLNVFAGDGMEGIPIQGTRSKEVLSTSVDQSMQGINMSSLGMNMGAEVAGAAVQAGKSLLKKHIKAVTIEVPAGYPVLLQNVQ